MKPTRRHISATLLATPTRRTGAMLACIATAALSCGAADVAPPDVATELERFEAAWSAPLEPTDPRFGVVRVLSFLNLDHPGLEKVKAAAQANDHDAASRELLAYFRATRGAPSNTVKPAGTQERVHADDALRHYFRGNKDVHPPVFRDARIDWTGRAFVDGKEIHDGEWYLQFQRLTWWPALANVYAATGDERYFREWRYELVRWAEDILPFTRKTPGFVSRGMETCSRCAVHIRVLPAMLRSPQFDAKTLLYFLASFHEQADHIPQVYAGQGNHRLNDLAQVFRNAIAFPEFKKADAWKNDALTLLPRMMKDAVYDDGMNKELVFSYHTMYIGLFVDAYNLFREHGYEKVLPSDYYPRLLKMAEIYAMQSFPDFTVCQFGDGWKKGDAGFIFRRRLAPFAADIPYFDYMVSGGRKGNPPARCSAAYPESGFYFFRSAWSPDAVFMPLKCGAIAEWHNQPDNGTFELYAYGRNLMTDSGCYLYGSSSPEDQRWRAWFRGTRVHQTLTLDHRTTDCKPKHLLWSESTNLVVLAVENQSYTGLVHRRTVLFVDQRHFLIHDEAEGAEAGAVRVHFQFAPCAANLRGLVAQTRFPQGANLLVKTFPVESEPVLEEEEGWISYAIAQKECRPAWSWKVDKKSGDPKVAFLTALVPYRERPAPETVEASVSTQGDRRMFQVKVGPDVRSIDVDLGRKRAAFR